MTLAIGFGDDARGGAQGGAALARAPASSARRAATPPAGRATWLAQRAAGERRAATGSASRLYDQSLMVLEASEDKLNRGASIASPTMPWVWGTLTLEEHEDSGPYHLVWPRDLYHVATAQQAAGDEAAADRLLDYLWRAQKPDGSWWQNTQVDGTPRWTTPSSTRSRCRSCWPGSSAARRPPTGSTSARPPTTSSPTGRETRRSAGRTRTAGRRTRSRPRSPGLICAADIARANGDEARAAPTRRPPTSGSSGVEEWTATDNSPYYSRRRTTCGSPRTPTPTTAAPTSSATTSRRPGRRARDRRPELPRAGPLRGQALRRPDGPQLARGRRPGARGRDPHGPIWHRFTFDGYGETATGADWDIFPTAARQTLGRAWPLLTGERGEYELLAGARREPHLRTIAGDRQRRADAARAGLGRPPADRRPGPPPARARARRPRSPGRTRSSGQKESAAFRGGPSSRWPIRGPLPLWKGAVPRGPPQCAARSCLGRRLSDKSGQLAGASMSCGTPPCGAEDRTTFRWDGTSHVGVEGASLPPFVARAVPASLPDSHDETQQRW